MPWMGGGGCGGRNSLFREFNANFVLKKRQKSCRVAPLCLHTHSLVPILIVKLVAVYTDVDHLSASNFVFTSVASCWTLWGCPMFRAAERRR